MPLSAKHGDLRENKVKLWLLKAGENTYIPL